MDNEKEHTKTNGLHITIVQKNVGVDAILALVSAPSRRRILV